MPRLHLFPTEAALEVALEEFIRARTQAEGTLEVGRGLTSVPRLLREASVGAPRELGRLAEGLLVRALCADGWGEGPMPASFAPRVSVALAALRRAGVAPSALRAVASVLPPAAKHDAQRFGAALARYEAMLGERRDEAASVRLALQNIAQEPLPSLVEIVEVEVHDAAPIDPLTRLVVEALSRRGLTVRCRIPDAPPARASGAGARYEEALAASVTLALDGLEAIELDHLERRSATLGPGPLPDVAVLPTPELEARAVAKRVRDEIAAGASPDEITVVATSREQRSRIVGALQRYEVPVEAAVGDPLAESGLAAVVRALLTLTESRIARDGLAALLSSRYLAAPRTAEGKVMARARIAALMRAALPTSARVADWRGNLTRWVAAQPAARRGEAEALARHVLHARSLLESLPERATLTVHAAALTSVLDRLGLAAIPVTRAEAIVGARAEAWARDEATARALFAWLEELPVAAARCGLGDRRWTRAEVTDLAREHLEGMRTVSPAGRGAAVTVCGLDRLPVRSLRLLVLTGMDDAALQRASDDPLIHEETRRTLGRALGRPVFSTPGQEEARERIRLAQVRGRAARVLVTLARIDAMGRAVLAGEVVTHARSLGAPESRPPSALIPSCEDARTMSELMARLLVEEGGDEAQREGLSEAARHTLRERLHERVDRRLDVATRRAETERVREAFFAGDAPAGSYDGRVTDAGVLARLTERVLPGVAARALSASTLTQHAQCPARFFFESVVRARPGDEQEDELDERASGTLAHLVLERMFTAWREAELFPLSGRPEEGALIDGALTQAVERFSVDQPLGNPILFAVRRRALRRLMDAVWQLEVSTRTRDGLVPHAFELRFDAVPVPGGVDSEPPLFVRGSIDRVDRSGDGRRAAVFDYKSARLQSVVPDLKEEALAETSWQLPIYAAVIREQLRVDDVQMVYYSLRDLGTKGEPAPSWVRFSPDDRAAQPLLSQRIWERVTSMRSGHFEVVPRARACERCRMQPVCRVAERLGEEQLTEETEQ